MSDSQTTERRGGDTGPDGAASGPPTGIQQADEEYAAGAADGPLPDQPAGRRASLWGDAWRELRTNPLFLFSATIILVFGLMAIWPSLFTDADPRYGELARSLERPSWDHWFGFDLQGRDYYARVIYGARVSMTIGVVVAGGAGLIALFFGSIAGYYGGTIDAVLSRLTDVFFAIPVILAGLVFIQALREVPLLSFDETGLFRVSLVLILFGWPTMMRIARSSVIEEKEKQYVTAARALGASDLRIITRHILPNAIAPVIVYATIFTGVVISVEATLSFLGVGLQLPAISWGLMVSGVQTRVTQAPHLLFFPGLFLSLTVFGFILLGDTLRDALDPRLR